MLQECSCEATQDVVNLAIGAGTTLLPASGSILAELVKNSTIVPMADLTAKLGEEMKAIPTKELEEQSDNSMHNSWMDAASEKAASIVNRRITTIREVVIPTINDIVGGVQTDIASAGLVKAIPNVKRYSICDALSNTSFLDEIKRDTDTVYIEPVSYFNEEPKDLKSILDDIKTGNDTFDNAIGVAISHIGADAIFSLHQSLFVDRAKSEVSTSLMTVGSFVQDTEVGLDYAIIIYMLAKKYEGSNKVAAREYKQAAAYNISRYLKAYLRAMEANVVIRNSVSRDGQVEVYTETYTKFLQQGGTVELIIGAAMSDKAYFTIEEILTNAQEVQRAYNLLNSSTSVEHDKKMSSLIKESIRAHFNTSFASMSEVENHLYEANSAAKSAVLNNFENCLNHVSASKSSDLFRAVSEILCLSRFKFIDCHDFLKSIDKYCEEGMDANDALVTATINEVSNYVTSQIVAK